MTGKHRAEVMRATGGRVRPGAVTALLEELGRAPPPAEAWERWLHAGARVGRFELVRELGRGGFGVVWEAKDTELGRSVAFKAVHAPGAGELHRERLLREAEASARLSHPNIVTIHDLGRDEHGPYLVLELLRGVSLAERLARGTAPVLEAIRIGVEVARALAHAHAMGVIHRDLKPGNVFLCDDGLVKVLDFGLARVFGAPAAAGGTPGHMAPEQWRGEPEDERTDLFALGVLLHRLLAGALPFGKERPDAPARPLELPEAPALAGLVGRLLELDQASRPRHASEVASALVAIQRELERHSPAASTAPADVRAYEFYLRGRQFLQQTRRRSLTFARDLFARAVELDPGFALAHAGLADAAGLLHMYYASSAAPPEMGLEVAERASARALELRPDLAEAHCARGLAHFLASRFDESRAEFERAIDLDPNLSEAHYYYARACFQQGLLEEAARRFDDAARVREDYQASFFAAQAREALGRHEEALAAYRGALGVVERHMDLNPDDPRAATVRAVALCRVGRREEGLHWAAQALLLDPQDAGVRYNVACLYALEGDADLALDALEEALRTGFGQRDWIARDPDLASLRDLPRFRALTEEKLGPA
jgi:tetratricopeptide (TPR) repeat protein